MPQLHSAAHCACPTAPHCRITLSHQIPVDATSVHSMSVRSVSSVPSSALPSARRISGERRPMPIAPSASFSSKKSPSQRRHSTGADGGRPVSGFWTEPGIEIYVPRKVKPDGQPVVAVGPTGSKSDSRLMQLRNSIKSQLRASPVCGCACPVHMGNCALRALGSPVSPEVIGISSSPAMLVANQQYVCA